MINHLRLEDPPGVKEYTLCALCFIMNFVTQTKKKKSFKMDFKPPPHRVVLSRAC